MIKSKTKWCRGRRYRVRETGEVMHTAPDGKHEVGLDWMVHKWPYCVGCQAAYNANQNRTRGKNAVMMPIAFTGPEALALMQSTEICAICGEVGSNADSRGHRLAIDHGHTTGKLRGILCAKCNRDLGIYERRRDEFEAYLRGVAIRDQAA